MPTIETDNIADAIAQLRLGVDRLTVIKTCLLDAGEDYFAHPIPTLDILDSEIGMAIRTLGPALETIEALTTE